MKTAKDVDEYIANAPKDIQDKRKQLRQTIKDCAPGAQERISYGMPYYAYKSRLAYFAYAKDHVGLYIPSPVIEAHKEELKAYGIAKATVRFLNKEELPIALIKKLIKARLRNIETQ